MYRHVLCGNENVAESLLDSPCPGYLPLPRGAGRPSLVEPKQSKLGRILHKSSF